MINYSIVQYVMHASDGMFFTQIDGFNGIAATIISILLQKS